MPDVPAFTLSIIVLAIFTHPKLFNNSLDKNRKFWISIFGVSGFMVFTGLAGISAGAWFSYACYANKLGPLIGPGSETTNFQNVSFYTPYWCCVLWIIVMCFMIVVGGVFGCRTCCNSGLDENVDVVVFDGEYPEKKTRMEQYKTEKYGNANESESKSYTSSSSRSTDSESGNGHDNNTYSFRSEIFVNMLNALYEHDDHRLQPYSHPYDDSEPENPTENLNSYRNTEVYKNAPITTTNNWNSIPTRPPRRMPPDSEVFAYC